MPGTKAGGAKAAATNKKLHGADFYAQIGAKSGRNGHDGGFASTKVGKDGLTGPERAKLAGSRGGVKSKRGEKRTHIAFIVSNKDGEVVRILENEYSAITYCRATFRQDQGLTYKRERIGIEFLLKHKDIMQPYWVEELSRKYPDVSL